MEKRITVKASREKLDEKTAREVASDLLAADKIWVNARDCDDFPGRVCASYSIGEIIKSYEADGAPISLEQLRRLVKSSSLNPWPSSGTKPACPRNGELLTAADFEREFSRMRKDGFISEDKDGKLHFHPRGFGYRYVIRG